jgi:hypothetical protein
MTHDDVVNGTEEERVRHSVEFVELNFPKTASAFKRLAGDGSLYRFFCVKQKDYGPENIRGGHDLSQRFGRLMSIREIGRRSGDKVARVANLTLRAIEANALTGFRDRLRTEPPLVIAPMSTVATFMQILDEEIDRRSPANESLTDSLVDLAIYNIIALIVEEGSWGF